MKVKSNKSKQTITLIGNAAEMSLLLELAEKMAQQKHDNTNGIEKQTFSDCIETFSEIKTSIQNGDFFS